MTSSSAPEPAPASRPSAAYPYLVSVRGTSPAVPARKEGRCYWLRHETYLGVVWPPNDITVLETFDPAAGRRGPR